MTQDQDVTKECGENGAFEAEKELSQAPAPTGRTLGDLIDKHLTREGYDGIISALELKLMAMRESERDALIEAGGEHD